MGGLVDKIIAAKKQYDESDRPWLSKLADGQLKKIAASCGCTATAEGAPTSATTDASKEPETPATDKPPVAAAAAPPATPTPPATPPAAPVTAAAAPPAPEKPLTAEEWIEKAPEHLRPVFGDLLAQRCAAEEDLREKIVAQSRGTLTKEYLASKPLKELEVLAAATKQPDYSGRGVQSGDPVAQAGKAPTAPRMPGLKIGTGAAA